MNQWLSLKQNGADFSDFIANQGIYSIAIYGMHYMGQRLYDELEGSRVERKYAIDRKSKDYNIPVVVMHPDDDLGDVDAIVVTPIFDFPEIRSNLLKRLSVLLFQLRRK